MSDALIKEMRAGFRAVRADNELTRKAVLGLRDRVAMLEQRLFPGSTTAPRVARRRVRKSRR